jgi:hypothetical protein
MRSTPCLKAFIPFPFNPNTQSLTYLNRQNIPRPRRHHYIRALPNRRILPKYDRQSLRKPSFSLKSRLVIRRSRRLSARRHLTSLVQTQNILSLSSQPTPPRPSSSVSKVFRELAVISCTSGKFWYGYHEDAHTSLIGVREHANGNHHCFSSDQEVEY